MNAMTTDERLTWEQICERYLEQFVVLVDHDRLPHDVLQPVIARFTKPA